MSTILFLRPNVPRLLGNGNQSHRATISTRMKLNLPYAQSQMQEDFSVEFKKPPVPELQTSRPIGIRFNRLQTSDELDPTPKVEFGNYVAREALIEEEYWTAAWLRAESHWEDRLPERYIESYKRKFADQEFNALKRRCSGRHIQNCSCIVAIKKEEKNVKRTVIKSIVGTLDLSTRNLLEGESFPGEYAKPSTFSSINPMSIYRYGYVANLCVAKFARRKGIASNMLSFALQSAQLKGLEQVFIHVNKENTPAQELYKTMGFQIVEMATLNSLVDDNYLMRLKL
ncbi:Acyl-CoA N-acyltransferases (NAT) superfamily protein [Thalictrum thalictroides]|uniref:Acyl-CoA N-acyltransferases (NAT) superfamily protein n=1 Tax=Thalictrum thalictroides TaxID=46969 RepID=A0A7J6W4K3_THATH|nr:Acyl-CoA N-acyltransferases (NAT) superfamily protein [Thalictrum thalictroides]